MLLYVGWLLTSIDIVKVVITERMKEALVGELGYLVEEVEDMEPQVSFLQMVWSSWVSFPGQMVNMYISTGVHFGYMVWWQILGCAVPKHV